MSHPLSCTTEVRNGYVIVSPQGEIDVLTAPDLRDALLTCVSDSTQHIVVDLAGVTFLDSTGLGVIIAARTRTTSAGGGLRLAAADARIGRILLITGLDRILDVYPTVDAAVADPVQPLALAAV